MRDHKNPGWKFWTACFAFAMLYPLGLGPFAWFENHDAAPPIVMDVLTVIYFPIVWLASLCQPHEAAMQWYVGLWCW